MGLDTAETRFWVYSVAGENYMIECSIDGCIILEPIRFIMSEKNMIDIINRHKKVVCNEGLVIFELLENNPFQYSIIMNLSFNYLIYPKMDIFMLDMIKIHNAIYEIPNHITYNMKMADIRTKCHNITISNGMHECTYAILGSDYNLFVHELREHIKSKVTYSRKINFNLSITYSAEIGLVTFVTRTESDTFSAADVWNSLTKL